MRYSTHTWTAVFATLLLVTATALEASAQTRRSGIARRRGAGGCHTFPG